MAEELLQAICVGGPMDGRWRPKPPPEKRNDEFAACMKAPGSTNHYWVYMWHPTKKLFQWAGGVIADTQDELAEGTVKFTGGAPGTPVL